jgi:Uma2 family endonuclease
MQARSLPAMLALMSTARRLHYSYEDYVGLLETSRVKLEYCDGEIYAMAGGTPTHGELASAINAILRNALGARCRIHSSEVKIRIEATGLSTFPDVSVVCGERRTAAIDKNAVVNPSLLVEVTSHSTEDYDRGEKLSHYQQLPSLEAVLIVSHRRPQVTVVARTSTGWSVREFRAGERLVLRGPEVEVGIDELYSGIELETE